MYFYKIIYEFRARGEAAAHQIFIKFDLFGIEINSEKIGNSSKKSQVATTYKIANMI